MEKIFALEYVDVDGELQVIHMRPDGSYEKMTPLYSTHPEKRPGPDEVHLSVMVEEDVSDHESFTQVVTHYERFGRIMVGGGRAGHDLVDEVLRDVEQFYGIASESYDSRPSRVLH